MSIEQRRQALITLLEDPNSFVQKFANTALEKLDAFAGFDHLLAELKAKDRAAQVQAVYGLAKVPGDRALRILVQCLKHPVQDVAAAAARVLQEQRDPRLLKPFCEMLGEVVPVVQTSILEALGQLRDRRAVTPILEQLPRFEPEPLERSIQALGRIGDPTAEQVLLGLFGHDDPRIRAAAALAIGNLSPEEG